MSGPKCGHVQFGERIRLQSRVSVAKGLLSEARSLKVQLEAAIAQGAKWSDIELGAARACDQSLFNACSEIGSLGDQARRAIESSSESQYGILSSSIQLQAQTVETVMKDARNICQVVHREIMKHREADERKRLLAILKNERADAMRDCGAEWVGGFPELRAWNSHNELSRQYDESLQLAIKLEHEGKLERAIESCRKAGEIRASMVLEAIEARQKDGVRNDLANAFMQALCDRNYDNPVYGKTNESDPRSKLRIEATVPNSNGKGNIQIEINLEGTVNLEIAGVPVGEEKMCREAIDGLKKSAKAMGADFVMDDWGRAASLDEGLSRAGIRVTSTEKIQQRY